MGTANTMCATAEILGLSPHGNASVRCQSKDWNEMAKAVGKRIVELVKEEVKPRDIIKKENFENAVKYMMATGGSTNSILHIPAMARQADIEIIPEIFDDISRKIPVISTIYPNHPAYTMADFSMAGGLGAVMSELDKAGLVETSAKECLVL